MTTANSVLPEHLRADVETLWNYHCLNDALRPADVGIGFGSHDLGVATHIANLYHAGYFPTVVFSGANAPSTVEVFPRGEAVHYREHALELGVPAGAVLAEPEATNTGENLSLTRRLLDACGVKLSSAIIASRPYQQRRVRATALKMWPGVEVSCTALPLSLDDYLLSIGDVDKVINFLVGDTHRVIEYPARGYMEFEEVTEAVVHSFSNLVQAGYTRRLLSSGEGPLSSS